jgi:hypothetical protein
VSPHVSTGPNSLPVPESSSIATCSVAPGMPPDREGLRCHHASCGSRPTTRCGKALASRCAPCHWACHPTGKGPGVATCPVAPDPPPSVGGLCHCHIVQWFPLLCSVPTEISPEVSVQITKGPLLCHLVLRRVHSLTYSLPTRQIPRESTQSTPPIGTPN